VGQLVRLCFDPCLEAGFLSNEFPNCKSETTKAWSFLVAKIFLSSKLGRFL
jgi:hypothetical protein